jgi:protein-S-isoprenylcysteine O-methyltransferase Ste14
VPDQNKKLTPFFVLQLAIALIVISFLFLRPGEWSRTRWVGIAIVIPAAVFLFIARWQLGESFSVTPQARKLVTQGIYSKIRNPIYVFSALFIVGVFLSLGYPYALLLLVIVIPAQIVRAGKEAKVLEARFGDEYREYRKGTWF